MPGAATGSGSVARAGRPARLAPVCAASLAVAFATAPVAARAGAPQTAQALLARADQVARRVAKIRGLSLLHPIARGVMNRAQIAQRLRLRMKQEFAPGQLAAQELAMKRMGLLPRHADYEKIVLGVLTDQIAGFYDPWAKELYIADWSGGGGDMLMAHEIDHALQDQHFNLRALMKPNVHNGDAVAARQALVEGDGTALMLEYAMAGKDRAAPWGDEALVHKLEGSMAAGVGAKLASEPLVVREELLFPYLDGLRFVVHFRKRFSWRRIDRIYRKPPLSTEQILHPDKYDHYERPDEVIAAQPAALAGYRAGYSDVSGELGLLIFLRAHGVPRAKAALAAAGWGGDRMVVYVPPHARDRVGDSVAVSYSAWDTEVDAIEFAEAATAAVENLAGADRGRVGARYAAYAMSGGKVASVERRGSAVVIVVGAAAAAAAAVRAEVWKGWRVVRH